MLQLQFTCFSWEGVNVQMNNIIAIIILVSLAEECRKLRMMVDDADSFSRDESLVLINAKGSFPKIFKSICVCLLRDLLKPPSKTYKNADCNDKLSLPRVETQG